MPFMEFPDSEEIEEIEEDSPERADRATQTEVNTRINQCVMWITRGAQPSEVEEQLSKDYGISVRTAELYRLRAQRLIRSNFVDERKQLIAESLNSKRFLKKKAAGNEDWALFRAVDRDIDKLLGLDAPVQTQTVNLNIDANNLPDDELDKRITELESRIATLALGSPGLAEGIQDASFREVEEDGGQVSEG